MDEEKDEEKDLKGIVINRNQLPEHFPTHRHSPEFWEQLGRAIATFGFLEEILGKAIFAFTATKKYSLEEIDVAYLNWLPQLERALTDPLYNLAEVYGKVLRERQNSKVEIQKTSTLVDALKEATKFRNVLCHGSWRPPDANGKTLPLFVNKNRQLFDTEIDVNFLQQVQIHVSDLACSVIESVTTEGLQFPGSNGPGEPIL